MSTRRYFLFSTASLLSAGRKVMAQSPPVLLTAAAKSTYAQGEAINIHLILMNIGGQSVLLSDLIDGNIKITALSRNGLAVPIRRSDIDYDEDFRFLLNQSLKLVSPGQQLAMVPWSSRNDSVLGGQALRTVQFGSQDNHLALFHSVSLPGKYALSLVYEFPVPSTTDSQLFRGATNEVTVAFSIV